MEDYLSDVPKHRPTVRQKNKTIAPQAHFKWLAVCSWNMKHQNTKSDNYTSISRGSFMEEHCSIRHLGLYHCNV